jgi:hypothetical protein
MTGEAPKPDALKGLILLSKASIERLQRASDTKTILANAAQAQQAVLFELDSSLGGDKDLTKELDELDAEIGAVDQQLAQVQEALLNVLTVEPPPAQDPGHVLKSILSTALDGLLTFSKIALKESKIDVAIFGPWNLERGLNRAIQKLQAEGLFPESDEEKQARVAERDRHVAGVQQFLGPLMRSSEDEEEEKLE